MIVENESFEKLCDLNFREKIQQFFGKRIFYYLKKNK